MSNSSGLHKLSILLLFFTFSVAGLSQNPGTPPVCSLYPGQTCQTAPVLCHPQALDGTNCFTLPFPNVPEPGNMCNGAVTLDNAVFYNFIATSSQLTMRITPFNCDTLHPNPGFEVGLYPVGPDCSLAGIPTFCKTSCDTNVVNILLNTLQPCYEYTLILDGCDGTYCEFLIEVGYSEPVKAGRATIVDGPNSGCAGERLCFIAEREHMQMGGTWACYPELIWTVDGVQGTPETNENIFCPTFTEAGTYEVCVEGVLESGCASSEPDCRTITIERLPDIVQPPVKVCWEIQPFIWYGQEVNETGTYTVERQTPQGCLYTVVAEFFVYPPPAVGFLEEIVCGLEPPYRAPDGNIYPFAGYYPLTLSRQNHNGCDSLMNLDLTYIDQKVFLGYECRDGRVLIKPDSAFYVPIDSNVVFEWYDSATKQIIGRDDSVFVSDTGKYCARVFLTHLATTCIADYCIHVPDFLPVAPEIFGDSSTCASDIKLFQTNASPGVCYNWQIPQGSTILGDPDSSRIEIDWGNLSDTSILVCLSLENDCGESDVTCIEVAVTSAPNPEAGSSDTLCTFNAVLNASPSSPGGQWSGDVNFSDISDPKSSITVAAAGTYTVYWTENKNGCTAIDSTRLTFAAPINALDVIDSCDVNDSEKYRVFMNVSGGLAPLSLVQGSGNYNPVTGEFVSDYIPSANNYFFVFEDAAGCRLELSGVKVCDCGDIDAGTMSSDTIRACIDEMVSGTSLLDYILEPGLDTFAYVLHEGNSMVLVNTIAQNYTGTFSFIQGQMIPGKVYYISLIAADKLGDGSIRSDDPCQQVAAGQPVIFYNYPNVDAGADRKICGLSDALGGNSNGLISSWRIDLGPGTVMIDDPDNPVSSFSVSDYGQYRFILESETFGCVQSDTVTFTFVDAPDLDQNITVECDSVAEKYRIFVNVSGGDPGTYQFEVLDNGQPISAGSFNTSNSIYTSPWIQNGHEVTIRIEDGNQCAQDEVSYSKVCDCLTEVGSISAPDLALCLDENLNFNYDDLSEFLDPNDGLMFYLHDGDANNIGNIIDSNDLPVFNFRPDLGMVPNQGYWIHASAANASGNTIDRSDRCLKVSNGLLVTFYEDPVAAVDTSGLLITCTETELTLNASGSSTNSGGNLSFDWSTNGGSFSSPGPHNNSTVRINGAGQFCVTITDQVSGCQSDSCITVRQSADVPYAEILTPDTINCNVTEIILDAGNSDQGQQFDVKWTTSDGQIVSGQQSYQAIVNRPGTYEFTITNSDNNCVKKVQILVAEDKAIPLVALQADERIKCKRDTVTINSDGTDRGAQYSYQWNTINGRILGSSNTEQINVTSTGTYWLVVTNQRNGCKDSMSIEVFPEDNIELLLNHELKAPNCPEGTDGRITVEVNGGTGQGPYEYSLEGSPFRSSGVFSGLSSGQYLISIQDANGCEKDTLINLPDGALFPLGHPIEIEIQAGDILNLESYLTGISTGQIQSIEWTYNGVSVTPSPFDPGDGGLVQFRLVDVNGCEYFGEFAIVVIRSDKYAVPNVFSPNDDELNDAFTVFTENRNLIIKRMQIFNRWGDMVFEKVNFKPNDLDEGWQGDYKGRNLNPDVFVYRIELELLDGSVEVIVGDVTLIR